MFTTKYALEKCARRTFSVHISTYLLEWNVIIEYNFDIDSKDAKNFISLILKLISVHLNAFPFFDE